MQFVIVGSFILIFCLFSIIKLFSGGHKILGVLWIILYIVSFFLTLGTGVAGAIPLCIFCFLGFIIPKKK